MATITSRRRSTCPTTRRADRAPRPPWPTRRDSTSTSPRPANTLTGTLCSRRPSFDDHRAMPPCASARSSSIPAKSSTPQTWARSPSSTSNPLSRATSSSCRGASSRRSSTSRRTRRATCGAARAECTTWCSGTTASRTRRSPCKTASTPASPCPTSTSTSCRGDVECLVKDAPLEDCRQTPWLLGRPGSLLEQRGVATSSNLDERAALV
mmetsp:Transcript_6166/g.25859  ORF Transcript_6166/g.25859 Transcript_6166/m.25859 type:complete len:210 (+) Transcript_6166:444-1073(+)